jgi:hypothetical protein
MKKTYSAPHIGAIDYCTQQCILALSSVKVNPDADPVEPEEALAPENPFSFEWD